MKISGVCLYYIGKLLLLRHTKTEYFHQCLLCRISMQNQTGSLVVTYRSPNQNNEFNEFLINFERLLNHVKQFKSSFLVILGDFNAQSKSWCLDDITNVKALKLIH